MGGARKAGSNTPGSHRGGPPQPGVSIVKEETFDLAYTLIHTHFFFFNEKEVKLQRHYLLKPVSGSDSLKNTWG